MNVVGSVGLAHPPSAVAAFGNTAWAGCATGSQQAIDITNPASPPPVGGVDTPGVALDVVVSETWAYLAEDASGLRLINVADPDNPILGGWVDTPGFATAVKVSNGYAFVADGNRGLQVANVGDPANPHIVSDVDTPGFARDIALLGTHAVIADDNAIVIVDIGNPLDPQIAGVVPIEGSSPGLDVSPAPSPYTYHVGTSQNGGYLSIGDFSNPSQPLGLGSVTIASHPLDVTVVDGRAYVVFNEGALAIINVENPLQPYQESFLPLPCLSWKVSYRDGIAYVANDVGGILAVDVSNPAQPRVLGGTNNVGQAYGVVVGETSLPFAGGESPLLFVADGSAGLVILPTHCDETTGMGDPPERTVAPSLSVYPNPGLASGSIRFATTRAGAVAATVHDIAGRRVREVFRGTLGVGEHSLSWDGLDRAGRPIPAGVYQVRVATADGISTTRYVVVR
jgi:hypothetical protein